MAPPAEVCANRLTTSAIQNKNIADDPEIMAEDKSGKENQHNSNYQNIFNGKNGRKIVARELTIEKPRIGWQPPDMNQHITRLISRRQQHESNEQHLKRQAHFNRSLLNRLNVEHCLKGHEGCVNCLEWSKDGRVLASGSDDTQVRIWDPFANKCLNVISTRHIGNIFSVKFIGDGSLVATGAGDQRIMVQSVNDTSNTVHLNCYCHTGRVKRLATCPDQPLLFWSAAEDGIAMQYDMRMQHECAKANGTVFVDLSSKSDLKSIAVNPTKTHLIAIGADDCYIRLYDRRMVKTQKLKRRPGEGSNRPHHDPDWLLTASPSSRTTPAPTNEDNTPSSELSTPAQLQAAARKSGIVRYLAPGHLAKDGGGDQSHKLATTYITFDATGNLLLANMGGDHIYLFDLLGSGWKDMMGGCRLQVPVTGTKPKETAETSWDPHECFDMECEVPHPAKLDMKIDLNVPKTVSCGCEYIKRATSFYKRNWYGDVYAAARDYYHVIKQHPRTLYAYRGLIKCLATMRWHDEARSWIDYAKRIFGDSNEVQERLHLREIFSQIESNEANSHDANPYESERDANVYDSDPDDAHDRSRGFVYSSTPLSVRSRGALPPVEKFLRQQARDYISRYVGHCNTTTDIKEANFLGVDNRYISAGSDDGLIFFWDRETGEIVNALQGDPSIVNCIQPHPSVCLLATSGIDKVVKIWTPAKEDGKSNSNKRDAIKATTLNQQRMSLDPFETILVDMGVNISSRFPDTEQVIGIPNCNTS